MQQLKDMLSSARYFWLAMGYLVVVVLVWHFRWPARSPSREYQAAVAMVWNHRIAGPDLRRPDGIVGSLGFYLPSLASIEGKYVKPALGIAPNAPISRNLLADHPDVTLPANTTAIVFRATDPKTTALLNAGSPVVLLGTDADTKAAVSILALVRAILCDTAAGNAQSCYPVLQITEGQAPVVQKNLATLRLVPAAVPVSP